MSRPITSTERKVLLSYCKKKKWLKINNFKIKIIILGRKLVSWSCLQLLHVEMESSPIEGSVVFTPSLSEQVGFLINQQLISKFFSNSIKRNYEKWCVENCLSCGHFATLPRISETRSTTGYAGSQIWKLLIVFKGK